jgi:hypothetical protein
MTTTATASLLTAEALAAVERALSAHDVKVVRHSIGSALHRADYLSGPDNLAALGWGEGLMFFEDMLDPEVFALIESHASLLCVAPRTD